MIVPDLRGFGQTEAPPRGYEKENMATDVLNLMDAMGLERVKLLAHDWGGWIAFILCTRAPERFEKYVALNIPHLWAKTNPKLLLNIWRFWYMVVIASPLGPVAAPQPARSSCDRVIQGSSPNPQRGRTTTSPRSPLRCRSRHAPARASSSTAPSC